LTDPLNSSFKTLDENKFKMLTLAREVSNDDFLCTVYNCANEYAVDLFLQDKISFTQIFETVEKAVLIGKQINKDLKISIVNFDDVFNAKQIIEDKILKDFSLS
jgi:1-deoxy-D-xylulose 5-phosphate reductoisomerase